MPESSLEKEPEKASYTAPRIDDVDRTAVRHAIESWRNAWAARDIDTYLKFYCPDFRGTKSDRKTWEAWRRKQIKAATGRIDLQIQEMRIVVRGDEARVRLKQFYRADNYGDIGIKELGFVRADGKWFINKEAFSPVGK